MTHYLDDFYYDTTTQQLYKLLPHYIYYNNQFYKRRIRRLANNRYRITTPDGRKKDVLLEGLETSPYYKEYSPMRSDGFYIILNNRLYQKDTTPNLKYIDNKVYRLLLPNPTRNAYQLYIRGHYVWVPITTLFPE